MYMKKFFAIAALLCCLSCVALTACGEEENIIPIEEISIVQPASTEIRAGEKFTLGFTTVPAEAAEEVHVNWEISNSQRLSYENGEFTALTCGTVKVTASVKGNEATDEIELKVIPPQGYTQYSKTGYSLIYPSNWTYNALGNIDTWNANDGTTTNMNMTTEPLNKTYMTASGSIFQASYETMYSLMGYTVNFTQPVKAEKSNYLGVDRVQVTAVYTLTVGGTSMNIHQTQMIFNNSDVNLSCVLTVTYRAEDYNDAATQLEKTVFSQFMPA